MKKKYTLKKILSFIFLVLLSKLTIAQVVLEKEIKITDLGLHFDGNLVGAGASNTGDNAPYDFYFGRSISAHGDCIKTYGNFVFMTWYRGGKSDRHVMLTRYNMLTGTMATIQFPHRHTGYQNRYWIGESHNTIAVGVSPKDGTIHLLYDMHSYSASRPSDGTLANDYFRYSYSIPNAATLPDSEFTLDKFVQSGSNNYKHLRMPGSAPQSEFVSLTYPKFFLNDGGDLFMLMREGGNNNGMYKFIKYDSNTGNWGNFIDFNSLNARNQPGITFNWGLYGEIKYLNGKLRIGFQKRSSNNTDKFEYQNGVYYAYSDDQNAATGWKNYKGQSFSLPLYDADFIKVMEPGDYVQTTQANKVRIVDGFDWTVTKNEDIHIISKVRDNQFNVTKYLHTYKPAGANDFITTEDFSGGGSELYTSGNDIYLIGLTSSKRVFVEKAVGGTNNFTRIYQATSGRTFDHGVVHINNGKLFYYLMENKTGNAQPLYLQIIDLGITNDPFRVSLTAPVNGQFITAGNTVQLVADAVNENGSITKVEFYANNTLLNTDAITPFEIGWTPTIAGEYTLKALAYNQNNEFVTSSEINVTVRENDPTNVTGPIWRIKNFETSMYLDSEDTDVIASVTAEGLDKEWEFVKAGDFYNIESKTSRGILRAAGSPVGEIINTGFSAPKEDSDKQWNILYNQSDKTYQFSTRNGNRFLYHSTNGLIEHQDLTDNRSKWILEKNTALSTETFVKKIVSVKIYPNPTKNNFTIQLNGFNKGKILIRNILGKELYAINFNKDIVEINNHNLKPGVYLVQVFGENNISKFTKLILN